MKLENYIPDSTFINSFENLSNDCIEDILEEELIKDLQYKYSTNNVDQTIFIFFIRSYIYYNNSNIDTEKLVKFLLLDLNLPEDLFFNNKKINIYRYGSNNLFDIMENFIFRYLDKTYDDIIHGKITGRELVNNYYIKYKEDATKHFKYKKKKDILNYKNVFNYYMLILLYKDFNCNIMKNKLFDNFTYPNNFILSKSLDEIYKVSYDYYIDNLNKFLEKDLEDYICKHGLDDIKIINRQLKVKSGIIDLLGIDSNNMKVLIELKITNRPVGLLWQTISYTEDIKNLYNEEIRTIVVAPKLEKSIFDQLPDFVEVYEFTKNKIFKFKKVK